MMFDVHVMTGLGVAFIFAGLVLAAGPEARVRMRAALDRAFGRVWPAWWGHS